MRQVICVLLVFSARALLDYLNLFLAYDKYLLLERKKTSKKVWLWLAIVLLISMGYGLVQARIIGTRAIGIIGFVIYYLKMYPLLWTHFEKRLKVVPFVLFFFLFISTLSLGFYVFIYGKYEDLLYRGFINDIIELTTTLLLALLFLLGLYFQKNNVLKIYFGNLTFLQYGIFCFALAISGFIEAGIMIQYTENMLLKLCTMLNIIAISMLMGQFMIVHESEVRKENVIDILDEQMKKVTGYYNEVIEMETQSKKFRHDIKNLLLVLHSLVEAGENEKALEYIEKMNIINKQTTNKFDTGNFVADALLNAKEISAQAIETEIRFQGYIPSEMENVDLVTLLSNILDNAIEACEKIEGPKVIEIDSVLNKHMWILLIKNPTEEKVKIHRNHIDTSKSNKELHGFGLQNIERVTQKYNGSLTLECIDGIFLTKTMLQMH